MFFVVDHSSVGSVTSNVYCIMNTIRVELHSEHVSSWSMQMCGKYHILHIQ